MSARVFSLPATCLPERSSKQVLKRSSRDTRTHFAVTSAHIFPVATPKGALACANDTLA